MGEGPVAGRLRRPGWRDPRLLMGVVLVAVSVTGVTALVSSADTTVAYFAAAETLTPGTVISEDDLVVVHVNVPDGAYRSVEGETPDDAPWGLVVTRVIGEGELVPVDALAASDDFDGRPVAVQTSLPLAEGIGPGSLVDVYLTTSDEGEATTRQVATGLVVEAVDTDSGSYSSGAEETVYVVVPRAEIEAFLDALATEGEISVVGLAGGGS